MITNIKYSVSIRNKEITFSAFILALMAWVYSK